jgi:hypothetical protein
MVNIQIALYLECCLEVHNFSYVHIRHQYMMHDMIKLQVLLYIFVLNDEYDHKVMHDVKLNIIQLNFLYIKNESL